MVNDEVIGPRFFRVLVPGFATELPIPHAFIKHVMKDRNREKATLVNSTGKTWHVDVYKTSGNVCFGGEGWREFVHIHNLSLGYMLVFRYRGNMVFRFRVYGLGCCEKLDVRYNRKLVNEKSDKMAHDVEQISSDSSPKPRRHSYKKKTVKTRKPPFENKSDQPPNTESKRNIVQPLAKKRKFTPPKKIVQTYTEEPKRKIAKARNDDSIPEPGGHSYKKRTAKTRNPNLSKSKQEASEAKGAHFEAIIAAANLKYHYMPFPATFRNSRGLTVADKEVILTDPEG